MVVAGSSGACVRDVQPSNMLLQQLIASFIDGRVGDFVKDEQITIKVDQPKFKNYLKNNGFELIVEERKTHVKGLKKIE